MFGWLFPTVLAALVQFAKTSLRACSCGGNILINVGPTRDGRLELIYQERLQQLGRWLSVNGEAVYGSAAWTCQNDTAAPHVWYTRGRDQAVYVFVLRWPAQRLLRLGSLRLGRESRIVLLGAEAEHVSVVAQTASLLTLQLPPLTVDRLPTPWAWALRVTGPASGHCPEQTRSRPKIMSYFLQEMGERPVWSP